MPGPTLHTDVKIDDEIIYVDANSGQFCSAIVRKVTDQNGIAVDLDVILGPDRFRAVAGAQHSLDYTSHSWHFPGE